MKEKLLSVFGRFGIVLWYIISFLYGFIPLVFLRFPFWVDFLLIVVMTSVPYLGEIVRIVLYIWAFVVVLHGPFDIPAIIFYVFFALYVLTTLLPLITSLLEVLLERKNNNDL